MLTLQEKHTRTKNPEGKQVKQLVNASCQSLLSFATCIPDRTFAHGLAGFEPTTFQLKWMGISWTLPKPTWICAGLSDSGHWLVSRWFPLQSCFATHRTSSTSCSTARFHFTKKASCCVSYHHHAMRGKPVFSAAATLAGLKPGCTQTFSFPFFSRVECIEPWIDAQPPALPKIHSVRYWGRNMRVSS